MFQKVIFLVAHTVQTSSWASLGLQKVNVSFGDFIGIGPLGKLLVACTVWTLGLKMFLKGDFSWNQDFIKMHIVLNKHTMFRVCIKSYLLSALDLSGCYDCVYCCD